MSRRIVHRPTRSTRPVERPEPHQIATPPTQVDDAGGLPIQFLLPVVGALTSVVMMVVLRNGQPLFLMIAAIVFVVAILGGAVFAFSARARAARAARFKRELYLDYLEREREALRERASEVRDAAIELDPSTDALPSIVRDPARRWERRRADSDFCAARIGTSTLPWFELAVPAAESPVEPADPILLSEAELVVDAHASVDGMPARIQLANAGVVAVIGDRDRGVAMLRALIAQLAAHHSPDDVSIALAAPPERIDAWAGVDLLPHTHDARLFDGPVPARRIAPDVRQLAQIIGTSLTDRTQSAASARRGAPVVAPSRLIVILDDHGDTASRLPRPDSSFAYADLGVTVIHLLADRLDEPDDVDVRVTICERSQIETRVQQLDVSAVEFEPDAMTSSELTALTRALAPLHVRQLAARESEDVDSFDITDLLGLDDPRQIDVDALWQPRRAADFLKVPFAVDDHGLPVYLDLKESAQLGMGPHGICVGATGSGKSEMLRTLILALAIAHPPEDLSMILVDYKGGAAFAPFNGLPHLAGLIDNLADDPQLTTRAKASLQGEVVRRQQMLKDADASPSITHYRELRRTRNDLPPMPHLFVVIDEFGELLTAEPDFVDLFLQIGRIGRSIGVHLLLSSQRIEAGKLRGLDTYLSYRLGLRTFSESESRVVLDTGDAFTLPSLPGYGYLKVDTTVYQRFRAGYVSGALPSEPVVRDEEHPVQVLPVPRYNGIGSDKDEVDAASPALLQLPDTGRQLVDEVVDRLRSGDRAVRPVWLPPLPTHVTLGQLLSTERATNSPFDVVVGLEDLPSKQEQRPWSLDLARSGGHVTIVGAPQSGRTTLLRTIAASLALAKTPREVAIYGMDLTGGGLRRLEGFPHVGGVATRSDAAKLRRLIEELAGMLTQREAVFKEYGIDSMEQLRSMHAAGQIPELDTADVVLLVDGYGALRQDFQDLEDSFVDVMLRASSFGLHLVMTLTRQSELRMAHQPLFGTKLELRVNDPSDSNIDRKLASAIADSEPGRVLTDARTFAQVALPLLDAPEDASESIGDALAALANRSAASWEGPSASPIRLLPATLDPAELPAAADEPDAVPLGLRQDTMSPAVWELLGAEPHLLVLGDAKSGKSTALRTIVAGLIERFSTDELAIGVVDSRGHVAAMVPEDYLAAHAKSAGQAKGLAESIASELGERLNRPAAEMQRTPRVVLIVDDHDIVAAGGIDPFSALLPHLPASRDIMFHLVVARPVAGSGRAMYSGTMQSLRDTGGSTLILSGDRAEGQILPRVYAEHLPPGRGRFVRRGERPHLVQIANTPLPASPAEPS